MLKEELDDTKALLTNTKRLKDELDADVNQLREKVTELTLREDDRAAEHEDLMNEAFCTETYALCLGQGAIHLRGGRTARGSYY